jgi:hypothetical protein
MKMARTVPLTLTGTRRHVENGTVGVLDRAGGVMSKSCLISASILLVACFSAGRPACADENGSDQAARKTTRTTSPEDKKAVLVDATRVSTDRVVESSSKQKSAEEQAKSTHEQSSDSEVIELRPASPDGETREAKPAAAEVNKKPKRGSLKNVHGTVYGGAGSAGHATGAAVGASTPSGKTSIYVESQQEKVTTPRR